jgi:small subunit ribosomal protein S8|tara:strand:- start:9864 stop:10262 length:399 start_codon:yes stop_codon:yes gene_type:complete
MVNDTISDMLTKIRNANNAKHQLVIIPFTKITNNIAKILKEEGFVENIEVLESNLQNSLLISLKYVGKNRKPVISKLQRISKPGLRVYTGNKKIPTILGNLGISIISTSQGLMTGTQAKEQKIGGEILCNIY